MINVRELHIGSKFLGIGMIQTVKEILDYSPTGSIQKRSGTTTEVDKYYSHLILVEENGNQYKPIEMEGIPLTPEILEACGFEKADPASYWHYSAQGYCFWEQPEGETFPIADKEGKYYKYFPADDDFYSCIGVHISSLHQLQNLFHSLTGGKELTYTPVTEKA